MDGLSLLAEARAAGLKVTADGDQLQVRGPRRAADLVKKLAAAKPQVLAVLKAESDGRLRRVYEELAAAPWPHDPRSVAGALLETELGAKVIEEMFAEIKTALQEAAAEEQAQPPSDKKLFGGSDPGRFAG